MKKKIGGFLLPLGITTALLVFTFGLPIARGEMKAPLVVLPKNIAPDDSLPAVVWLHGYGANPSKIISEPIYQDTADRLHVAIVGVYAPNNPENDSFTWSELPTIDLAQVMDSLKVAEQEKQIHFTTRMLFGFSQGACVAADLAAKRPDVFRGAIILSPGSDTRPGPLPATEANRGQIYYLSVGGEEALGNIEFTRLYASYLSKTGATVHAREVPGMKTHNRPPDWAERLPEWITSILSLKP